MYYDHFLNPSISKTSDECASALRRVYVIQSTAVEFFRDIDPSAPPTERRVRRLKRFLSANSIRTQMFSSAIRLDDAHFIVYFILCANSDSNRLSVILSDRQQRNVCKKILNNIYAT
jgi:hypothetical protein